MTRERRSGGLLRARRGSTLPIVAMGIGVLAGAGALGVDAGWLYLQRDRLQQTADAMALAGARQLPDEAAARAATAAFASRLPDRERALLRPEDVTVGGWDEADRRFAAGDGGNALRVTLRRDQARGNAPVTFLASLFGVHEVGLVAAATARRARPSCIYALDAASPRALDLNGGSGIAIPACAIQVNSTAADALTATGGSTATAQRICVTGDYSLSGVGSSLGPTPETGCPSRPDPFADLAPLPAGACDWIDKKLSGGKVTLGPGVYCGGLSLGGGTEATFLPGIYVIRDGALESSGGSTIEGHGVAFYLTGTKASVQLTGGGRIDLSAPTSGPMAGFVLAAGADVPEGTGNKLSGGGRMRFVGALHFPRQDLTLSGGSEGLSPSPFTVIVGRRINITGGGTLRFGADPGDPAVPPAYRPEMATVLVE